MKTTALLLLASLGLLSSAFAHGEVEIGPNGGRILEFSKDETMHGEVTVKDGRFLIALLDKNRKPVAIETQQLTATLGDRSRPEKLPVETQAGKFAVPLVKAGEWVIFQFRPAAKAKPVTARLHYDTAPCGACKKPEWLCICHEEPAAKK